MRILRSFILSFSLLAIYSCQEDHIPNIDPPDDRVATAVNDLRQLLVSPDNGWVLNYKPTPDAGTYYILMDFTEDMVTIESDVPDQDGGFYEQTIPYRIDPQLGLELVFETYGVLHFLFEQDQSTFGAEFEFVYAGETDGNLMFVSKTDGLDIENITVINLEPAPVNANAAFSRELAENLQAYDTLSPIIFGGELFQQLYFTDLDISVFWNIDLLKRTVNLDIAAEGESIAQIVANNNYDTISLSTGYTLADGKLILEQSVDFELNGSTHSLNEIEFGAFGLSGEIFCGVESTPVYQGNTPGMGALEMRRSYFQSGGLGFGLRETPYSVNVLFVIDGENSISQEGIINDLYPEAGGFIFSYGALDEDDPSFPAYAVGISFSDDDNLSQLHMRGYDMTTVMGNLIEVNLNEEFYFSDGATENEDAIRQITDEIFSDGRFYISEVEIEGLDFVLFRLFNPCTSYEFFLVQPNS